LVDAQKLGIDQKYWSKSGHRPKIDQEKWSMTSFKNNTIETLPNYTAARKVDMAAILDLNNA